MKRILLGLVIVFGLSGCTGENPYYPFMDSLLKPAENVELVAITNLPKDKNGFYYFQLYQKEGQNLQTLTGSIRINGKVPDNPQKYNIFVNLLIFARTIIAMPIFYIMVIKNLLTRKK